MMRAFPTFLAAICLLVCSVAHADRPNIVLVMADDLGWSDIGCYGGEIRTPHIDSLARDGLRFTQFYNNAVCGPTRASLLTGLYCQQAGHRGDHWNQPKDFSKCVLVSELLQHAGYHTMMVGKWQGRDLALDRGFDRFFGPMCQAKISYFHEVQQNPFYLDRERFTLPEDFYLTKSLNEYGVRFLKDAVANEKPFFLYVAHIAPHWPLHAPETSIASYRQQYRERGWEEWRAKRFAFQRKSQLIPTHWKLAPQPDGVRDWKDEPHKNWQAERMAVYAAQVAAIEVLLGIVVFTAIGLVDGIDSAFFCRNDRTPGANFKRHARSLRSVLGTLARRMVVIRVHAVAGSMDNRDALQTRVFQNLVQPRGKLLKPPYGILAMVQVPYIADDDRGFVGFPFLVLFPHLKLTAAIEAFRLVSQGEREILTLCGRDQHRRRRGENDKMHTSKPHGPLLQICRALPIECPNLECFARDGHETGETASGKRRVLAWSQRGTSMIKRTLGQTGLEVTDLGYGSMGLRGPKTWGVRVVREEDAELFLNHVLDAGINLIDTSPDYGQSEERIGRYIGHRRSEFYLATKCGCVYTQHENHLEIEHVWKKEVIERNVETSLRRLRTDYVDVLQFHGGDAKTLQREGLIEFLLDLRDQGIVRFVGVSSSLPHLPGLIDLGVFDTFQIPYSCLSPEHHDLITRAEETGAGLIIRGGIAHGGPDAEIRRPALEDVWTQAKLDEVLPEGMKRAELILRYTLSHPHVHTTIVGTCNPAHLAENVVAADHGPLPEEIYNEITARVAGVIG